MRYNNANVQQRFGNNNLKAGASNRMDFRGRDGQQVLRPGQDRPGSGDRAGIAPVIVVATARARAIGRVAIAAIARARRIAPRRRCQTDAKGGGDRAKAANRGSNAARGGGSRGSALNVSSGQGRRCAIGPRPGEHGRGRGAASFAGAAAAVRHLPVAVAVASGAAEVAAASAVAAAVVGGAPTSH